MGAWVTGGMCIGNSIELYERCAVLNLSVIFSDEIKRLKQVGLTSPLAKLNIDYLLINVHKKVHLEVRAYTYRPLEAESSMCKYVRSNDLKIPNVHRPCINAPNGLQLFYCITSFYCSLEIGIIPVLFITYK